MSSAAVFLVISWEDPKLEAVLDGASQEQTKGRQPLSYLGDTFAVQNAVIPYCL